MELVGLTEPAEQAVSIAVIAICATVVAACGFAQAWLAKRLKAWKAWRGE